MTRRHTGKEIEDAAQRFERIADSLNVEEVEVEDLGDLRAVAMAADAVRQDERQLRSTVAAARSHGRSWNLIAAALGVSRQAARQRFAGSDEHTAHETAHGA